MHTIVSVFISLLCLTTSSKARPLEIHHLTDSVYVFTTYQDVDGQAFPANGLYAVTSKGVIMIDMPWDRSQTLPLLDSIARRHGKKVVLSVSTHFHGDRTGASDILEVNGVETWCSKSTLELCRKNGERQPEHTFTKDTSFRLGNMVIQTFYPGAGHTEDNILIWFPAEKILYGGCFIKSIESQGLGNVADADVNAWEPSAQRAMRKYPAASYIIPGHGSWKSRESLAHTLRLVRKAKKNG